MDANTLTGSSLLDLVQAELREPLRRTIAEYGRSNALPDTSTRSPTIRLTLSTVNGLMPISMWIYRSPPGVANGMQSPSPCFVVVQIMSGQAQDEAPEGMLSSGNLPRDVYGIMDPTRASSFPYEREKLRSINKKLQEELASFQPSRKRPAEDITSTLASPFTAVFADASITM